MLTIERIAGRCEKVRWQGKASFTACCVAHDDRNPSMSVTEAQDGTILVHCHSGCPQSAVLDALGMRGERRQQAYVPSKKTRLKLVSPTADYAKSIWSLASDDVATHPYAIKKRITHAFGALRGTAKGKLIGKDADCIIVPNRDWEGQLVGVECINADGVKQTFGSKGLLILGNPEDALRVNVCEGWATAWALSQLFPERFACIVAFGKSKLDKYADTASKRYWCSIVIHVDTEDNVDVWDTWASGKGDDYVRAVSNG